MTHIHLSITDIYKQYMLDRRVSKDIANIRELARVEYPYETVEYVARLVNNNL